MSKTENAMASRRFDVMTPGNTKVIIVRHVINTLHIKTYSRITIRHDKQIYMTYAHLPRIYWTDQLFQIIFIYQRPVFLDTLQHFNNASNY